METAEGREALRGGGVVSMAGFLCAYITCRDAEEAKKISRALVEKKLAACANIIPEINSIYRWKGEIHDEKEALIFAKTTAENRQKIIETVKGLHSYDTPAILFYRIEEGSADYLKWIREESGAGE